MLSFLRRLCLVACVLHAITLSARAEHAVWKAGPPGPCTRWKDTKANGVSRRLVECVSVFSEANLPDASCDNAMKPCSLVRCSCRKMKCVTNASATWAEKPGQIPKDCHKKVSNSWKLNPPAISIGYLGVSQDYDEIDTEVYLGDPLFPSTCIGCEAGADSCHEGFPFFRINQASAAACAKHCFSLGLDLAGFVINGNGGTCRCGATNINKAVLRDNVRACLMLDSSSLTPDAPTGVPRTIEVFRYSGYYLDDGLPEQIAHAANDLENRYIDSVVSGKSDEDEPPETLAIPDVKDKIGSEVGWARRCFPYPNQCAGVGPLQTMIAQTTMEKPEFDDDDEPPYRFNKYLVLRYMFNADVDDKRKEVFREAVAIWQYSTCLSFVEDGDLQDRASYEVEVRKVDDGCSATLGMPNVHKNVNPAAGYIKLGWCNEMRYVGNVVHELGHILGMNHEQARPDGSASYNGKGPFLQLKWENIPSSWQPYWQGDPSAYTGSASDGANDVQIGYASYDFESIMHYSVPSSYGTTIPSGQTTGNRKHLSEGDIKQILDMYNCHIVDGILSIPTPVAPATTTGEGDQSATTDSPEDDLIMEVPDTNRTDQGVVNSAPQNVFSTFATVFAIFGVFSSASTLPRW